MAKGSFCNLCGRPTHGRYRVYRRLESTRRTGLVVCDQCERERSRCKICRVPISSPESADGFCPVCEMHVPHCTACGQRVQGRFVLNEATGAAYCETCFNHRPRCGVCGGPVGEGGHQLHDGRFICTECHATAVYDAGQAQPLYQRVVTIMTQQVGIVLNIHPTLSLVDRNEMLTLLEQLEMEAAQRPERVFGLFYRNGRQRTIYVENGLPQILMIQVVAHEYAHAWQGENCPLLEDPLVGEGFAEWAAHRTLAAMGAVKKAALMEQRADIYGQGLMLMLELERHEGSEAVFEACRLSGTDRQREFEAAEDQWWRTNWA